MNLRGEWVCGNTVRPVGGSVMYNSRQKVGVEEHGGKAALDSGG